MDHQLRTERPRGGWRGPTMAIVLIVVGLLNIGLVTIISGDTGSEEAPEHGIGEYLRERN